MFMIARFPKSDIDTNPTVLHSGYAGFSVALLWASNENSGSPDVLTLEIGSDTYQFTFGNPDTGKFLGAFSVAEGETISANTTLGAAPFKLYGFILRGGVS